MPIIAVQILLFIIGGALVYDGYCRMRGKKKPIIEAENISTTSKIEKLDKKITNYELGVRELGAGIVLLFLSAVLSFFV